MFIKVSSLSDGIHNLDFNGKAKEIGLKEPFTGQYKLSLKIDKSHSQVVLDSDLLVETELICDRCDEQFKKDIQVKFEHIYLFGKADEQDEQENITYSPLDTDKLDFSKELYDYSLLALPMKKLCSEECKGLCLHCGKNLNKENCECSLSEPDERWKPLIELKKKLEKD